MVSHLENPRVLEVQVFNGREGSFDLYEDAGEESAVTHLTFLPGKTAVLTAEITGEGTVIPEDRKYELKFRAMANPTRVLVDGKEVCWRYEAENCQICVTVDCGRKNFRVELEGVDTAASAPDMEKAIYNLLHRAQIPYAMKTDVYDAVCAEKELSRKVRKLVERKLPETLLGAVLEWIL